MADELHNHHLVARSQGGSDDETNLITLCVECHGLLHGVDWQNNHPRLVRAGLARAKDEGKTLGRPKTTPATEKAIRAALSRGGEGMHKIAARFGVGTGTVQRIRRRWRPNHHSAPTGRRTYRMQAAE
jgi:hypothetical protein